MWKPTSTLNTLKARAEILQSIREFFKERHVLEVETPCLSISTITDPYLESLEVDCGGDTHYLQTSPEYHMKRLLAAGSGDIFQLCKSFRKDETGRLHNPEFMMLEWYRLGFDDGALMDEIDLLIQRVLKCEPARRLSYNESFQQFLGLDLDSPLTVENFKAIASQQNLNAPDWGNDRDAWLLYLFSEVIEPELQEPTFIYDFPATQASLARLKPNGKAGRFELYIQGIELANGFWELSDPLEQQKRFEENQRVRAAKKLQKRPIDFLLLEALKSGLPGCAGVALGVDRLMMLALGKKSIKEVMSFVC